MRTGIQSEVSEVMSARSVRTWVTSPDELAYNNRNEGCKGCVTNHSCYKAKTLDDGTVAHQGVEESLIEADGSGYESELMEQEEKSRSVRICEATIENGNNAAASLPSKLCQQQERDRKADHERVLLWENFL